MPVLKTSHKASSEQTGGSSRLKNKAETLHLGNAIKSYISGETIKPLEKLVHKNADKRMQPLP